MKNKRYIECQKCGQTVCKSVFYQSHWKERCILKRKALKPQEKILSEKQSIIVETNPESG